MRRCLISLYMGMFVAVPLQAQKMILSNIQLQMDSVAYLNVNGGIRSSGSILRNEGFLMLSDSFVNVAGATYAGEGEMVFSGLGAQVVSGLSAIQNVTVNNGTSVDLSENLTLNGTLRLPDGKLRLGPHRLTLGDGAVVSGYDANNYIQTDSTGTVDRAVGATQLLFPVGDESYAPVLLQNDGTLDTFRVRVQENLLSNGTSGEVISSDAVNKTWFVEEAISGGSDVSMTLQWRAADERSDFDHTQARFIHHNGLNWEVLGTGAADTVSAGMYSLSQSGLSSFSPYGVNDPGAPLPVEWLSFEARKQGHTALLQWSVRSTEGLASFVVERAMEGHDFQPLATLVPGPAQTYQFLDPQPGIGPVYFRVRQTDWDGQQSYTKIQSLLFEAGEGLPQISPNPFVRDLNINLQPWTEKGGQLRLYDSNGRLVGTLVWSENTQELEVLSLGELPAGVYHLHLQTVQKYFQTQVVKL